MPQLRTNMMASEREAELAWVWMYLNAKLCLLQPPYRMISGKMMGWHVVVTSFRHVAGEGKTPTEAVVRAYQAWRRGRADGPKNQYRSYTWLAKLNKADEARSCKHVFNATWRRGG